MIDRLRQLESQFLTWFRTRNQNEQLGLSLILLLAVSYAAFSYVIPAAASMEQEARAQFRQAQESLQIAKELQRSQSGTIEKVSLSGAGNDPLSQLETEMIQRGMVIEEKRQDNPDSTTLKFRVSEGEQAIYRWLAATAHHPGLTLERYRIAPSEDGQSLHITATITLK